MPSPSLFEDPAALAALYAPPAQPECEPPSNFPLPWYQLFLQEIQRLGIQVITYRDLFEGCDDWDYASNYQREHTEWHKRVRDPARCYLVIQHDVDNRPSFTRRMVAMEAAFGVRSNIFIFRNRYSRSEDDPEYDVDHAFLQDAERRGFVIGYHQNALALAGFDPQRAVERYRSDVAHLDGLYRIEFVVPHGGAGQLVDGRMLHNVDVPMPPELEGRLRWVSNGHGVRFANRWSDGGLGSTRDPQRIAGFDIVGGFLRSLRPGTRNFCLIHPQRWGYCVDPGANPLLAEQPWYQDVVRRWAPAVCGAERSP